MHRMKNSTSVEFFISQNQYSLRFDRKFKPFATYLDDTLR
jgi:hypothetical protein